jgi:hypothetical protein
LSQLCRGRATVGQRRSTLLQTRALRGERTLSECSAWRAMASSRATGDAEQTAIEAMTMFDGNEDEDDEGGADALASMSAGDTGASSIVRCRGSPAPLLRNAHGTGAQALPRPPLPVLPVQPLSPLSWPSLLDLPRRLSWLVLSWCGLPDCPTLHRPAHRPCPSKRRAGTTAASGS